MLRVHSKIRSLKDFPEARFRMKSHRKAALETTRTIVDAGVSDTQTRQLWQIEDYYYPPGSTIVGPL